MNTTESVARAMAPRNRRARPGGAGPGSGCQVAEVFRLLGKAHMLDILHAVMNAPDGGPLRFVDIQNQLRISPNTLSERLKELVAAGLLTRTAHNQIPPRVDYAATAKLRDLEPVFTSLVAWARQHDLKPVADPAARRANA